MNIQYWQPLENGLQAMKRLLFQPFDIGRWFVLGFTVWLIHLGQGGGSGAGNNPEFQTSVREGDVEGALESLGEAVEHIMPTELALILILGLVAVGLVVGIVLLWVGCRARFIWIENLTSRTHTFGANWTRFGHLGDSFFLWKIAYFLVLMVVVIPLLVIGGAVGIITGEGLGGPASLMGWMALGFGVFVVAVVAGYIDFFAESFVTVIMHRRNVGVLEAWRIFRQMFEANPGHFVLVGLMKLVLHIVSGIVVLMLGLLTCCVGLVLLVIPYIGTVVMLPVYAGLRYFDLYWLGQISPDLGGPASNDGGAPMVTPPPQLPPGATATPNADAPTPDSDPTP